MIAMFHEDADANSRLHYHLCTKCRALRVQDESYINQSAEFKNTIKTRNSCLRHEFVEIVHLRRLTRPLIRAFYSAIIVFKVSLLIPICRFVISFISGRAKDEKPKCLATCTNDTCFFTHFAISCFAQQFRELFS